MLLCSNNRAAEAFSSGYQGVDTFARTQMRIDASLRARARYALQVQKAIIFVPGRNQPLVCVLMPSRIDRQTKGGITMRSSIFAIPALAILASASFLAGSTPARAADDPVCLEGSAGEGTQCDFETLAQCQATLSGMDGTCEANGPRAMMKTKMAMKDLKFKHSEKAKK